MLPIPLSASSLQSLSPEKRNELLGSLTETERAIAAFHWPLWARSSQLPPPGDWQYWMFMAGRGAGKTRAGAEWVRDQVEKHGCRRIALIAPTAADARDVMICGISGLLAVCPPWNRPIYEPSKRRLSWPNGAEALLFSAEEPERLRGPQFDCAWMDELCAWNRQQDTFDMLAFALRLGDDPRCFISTTPKPQALIRDLLKEDGTVVTRGRTKDNAAHLAGTFIDRIVAQYQGTRLGRQELEGELLEDVEGALWTTEMIEQGRVQKPPMGFKRIVVGVDPSGGGGSMQGIVVVGRDADGHIYVLEDASCASSPAGWAERVIQVYDRWGADRIVAEKNYGGDMVKATIQAVRPTAPVKMVSASRGKHVRAEPIAALYEQGKVHHVGVFSELEDQMHGMTTEGFQGYGSPDRVDALVWAVSEVGRTINRAIVGNDCTG